MLFYTPWSCGACSQGLVFAGLQLFVCVCSFNTFVFILLTSGHILPSSIVSLNSNYISTQLAGHSGPILQTCKKSGKISILSTKLWTECFVSQISALASSAQSEKLSKTWVSQKSQNIDSAQNSKHIYTTNFLPNISNLNLILFSGARGRADQGGREHR